MSDLTKRTAIDVVASAAGGTVGPTVTALMATAAAVTHNPDLVALSVPAGALADATTERGILLVSRTLLNPAERVGQFATAVSEEASEPIEEFIEEHITDARQQEFLGHVVDAATAARSDWKTRILAHAFVRGARDGDRIDETEMFIAATRDLEAPHARFLAATHKIFQGDGNSIPDYIETQRVLKADEKIGPGFKMTDLGFVTAWWLGKLGAELDELQPNVRSKFPASGG